MISNDVLQIESTAFVDSSPWGIGKKVPTDLTPKQMMKAASVDWTVRTVPAYVEIGGKKIESGTQALVRDSDDKILDMISDDWIPHQNEDAFEFFNDFIAKGDMEMDTAGSLKGGKLVWALAKVKDSSFELFGGKDRVDSYMLFTNPHMYGRSIDVRFVPIRVTCNNSLALALKEGKKNVVKVSHRREFDSDEVKLTLGMAADHLESYKEAAEFLSTKRFNHESMEEYFKRVFPFMTGDPEKKNNLSRNATSAIEDHLQTQPGAELGEGTYWQLFNTVTYMTDHVVGRTEDSRMSSSWYGANKGLKIRALETAVEMADA